MENEFNILIAEDDDGHVDLIKKTLAKVGFRTKIRRFSDGQEVLDFLFTTGRRAPMRENRKFLLLLDIRMPKVNGIDVLERIRRDKQLKDLPVVMLTCSDDSREIDRCRRLGCNDYIVKPIRTEQFSRVVERAAIAMLVSILETAGVDG